MNRDEIKGKAGALKGQLKQAAGDITKNPRLHDAGVAEEALGKMREAVGRVRRNMGEVLKDVGTAIKN